MRFDVIVVVVVVAVRLSLIGSAVPHAATRWSFPPSRGVHLLSSKSCLVSTRNELGRKASVVRTLHTAQAFQYPSEIPKGKPAES